MAEWLIHFEEAVLAHDIYLFFVLFDLLAQSHRHLGGPKRLANLILIDQVLNFLDQTLHDNTIGILISNNVH